MPEESLEAISELFGESGDIEIDFGDLAKHNLIGVADGPITVTAGKMVSLQTGSSVDPGSDSGPGFGAGADAQIGHEVNTTYVETLSDIEEELDSEPLSAYLASSALSDITVTANDGNVELHAFGNFSDTQIGSQVANESITQDEDNFDRSDIGSFGVAEGAINVTAVGSVSLIAGQSFADLGDFDTRGYLADSQIGHETSVFDAHDGSIDFDNAGALAAYAGGLIFVAARDDVTATSVASESETQIGHEASNRASDERLLGVAEDLYKNLNVETYADGDIKIVAVTGNAELHVVPESYYSQSQFGHEVTGYENLVDSIGGGGDGGRGEATGHIFVVAGSDIRLINEGAEMAEVHIGHGSLRGFYYEKLEGDIVTIAGKDYVMEGAG